MPRLYEPVTTENYHGRSLAETPAKSVWAGFRELTTSHGVPHVDHARGPVKKILWLLLSLAAFSGFLYNAFLLTDKFIDFDVNVAVEIRHDPDLVFPAVTVCNNNPLIMNKMMCHPDLMDALGMELPDRCVSERKKRAAGPAGSTTTTPSPSPTTAAPGPAAPGPAATPTTAGPGPAATPTTAGPGDTGDTAGDSGYGYGDKDPEKGSFTRADGKQQKASYELRKKVQKLLADMDPDELTLLGYELEDFIVDCEYQGASCNMSEDFTMFVNNIYGNCYTFNSGWNQTKELERTYKPGPDYGLKLTFNVDEDSYIGELAEAVGVRVVIHPQERMPFPEDEGLGVSAGLLTSVGVRMLVVERKGGRFGNCTDINEPNYSRNVYEEIYGVNYSTNACYKTCYQKHVISTCNCADINYPSYGKAFEYVQVEACDITNLTQVSCMDTIDQRYAENNLSCSCPTACYERTFLPVASSMIWPSDSSKASIFESLAYNNIGIRRILNDKDDKNKFERNLGKVEIFLQEFNYEKIKETEAYSAFSFVSDIGGILGLYIGFSLLTIAEFIELGVDMLAVLLARRCSGKQGARTVTPVKPAGGPEVPNTANSPPPPYTMYRSPDKTSLSTPHS